MKKSLTIICGLFTIVFCTTVTAAESIDIDDALIVFDNREKSELNSINLVAIVGWSSDGKVAIIQQGSYYTPAWLIIDVITDKVVDEDETYMVIGDDDSLHAMLDTAMKSHNITKNPGRLIELPYTFPENMQPLTIEYDEIKSEQEYDVYAVRGSTRKKISGIFLFGNSPEIKNTFAVKSPFEDRLLIITHASGLHIEFDYTFFSFHYAGCHTTARF